MTEQKKITRRGMFAGLGAVAAAGLAAKLSPKITPSNPVTPAESSSAGYRLTDHVKKYYRTTKI